MDLKRIITDILAIVLGLGGVIAAAVEGIPDGSDWYIVGGVIIVAVISWFTGRNGDGSKKERITKH